MTQKPTLFIDGEAGTTGLLIRERLSRRDDLELVSIHPDKRKDSAEKARLLNSVDVAILCLPDDAAVESVGLLESTAKTKIIDASTAFRTHENWAYGFAEMSKTQREKIRSARFITNPGCWPQGFIALVKPLQDQGLLNAAAPLFYHGISGYSGGGKKMIEDYEAGKAPEFMPYALRFKHKHLPEMKKYTGVSTAPLFQPAVGNFAQGMLTTLPLTKAHFQKSISARDLHAVLKSAYEGQQFIEVADFTEEEKRSNFHPEALNNTNKMRLYVFADAESQQIVLAAVYDNLGKGASGAAIQNLNIVLDKDETTGLIE